MIKYFILLNVTLVILFSVCNNQSAKEGTKEKFRWDFNSEKIYSYSFEQSTRSIHDWGSSRSVADTNQLHGTGQLKIKSKGNDKADFVLEKLKLDDKDDISIGAKENALPPQTLVVPDMNADGGFDTQNTSANSMLRLMFSLPSYDLKVGEKERLDLAIPFNLQGSPLMIKGFNEIQYVKDIQDGDARYAFLKCKIKVDELDVPEEIKGTYASSFIGEAEYEFDIENKHFLSATIDLDISMESKNDDDNSGGRNVDMSMKSYNKYHINFIGIEGN